MKTEIEATFTDIDKDSLRAKLKAVSATLAHPERLIRRTVFDFPDLRLNKINGWVRVRDEGDRITLTYKQQKDDTLLGTHEATVVVDDYDRACELLQDIGLSQKAYQETKREQWVLGRVEISIDTWPWIPAFIEIEGQDGPSVKSAAAQLGFDWNQARFGCVDNVYQLYFDVANDEINTWKEITFTPTPDWLEEKRHK